MAAAITRGALTLAVLSALLLIAARPAQAQNETVLYSFTGSPDGDGPMSSLTSYGGNLYGTTASGGTFTSGTVYELSPNGSGGWNETTLYSFTGGTDGGIPEFSNVIFDGLGNLYGTALYGGDLACNAPYGCGVVFELSPSGSGWVETVLYSFTYRENPYGGLIFDSVGNLYGTAYTGVFELSPSGAGWTEQVIYGAYQQGGLTMDAAGNIYGEAYGGTYLDGTVFELSPDGSGGWNPTVIHNFAGYPKDGTSPTGTLVFDKAGNLYGTTYNGGAKKFGTVYKLSPVTTGTKKGTWTEKVLYSFKGGTKDGASPGAGIVLDSAGNIYGTTTSYGKYGDGTLYELAVSGATYKEKILWSFNGTNGELPEASLIWDSAGNLYGTTESGGSSGNCGGGCGVVFEVNPGAKATSTTLTSAPNPSTSGEAVTFTAVVTPAPPDGETVSFMEGKTVLGTGTLSGGSASFTTSVLPVGTATITAVYGGDLNLDPSTSKALKQVVKK